MRNPLTTTIRKLAPAVLTSLLATSLGLLSLLQSRVPMIQDFGKMLTIGIVAAFLLALFLLLPVLLIQSRWQTQSPTHHQLQSSRYIRIMTPIVRFILRFRYPVLVLAILAAILGFTLDQNAGIETDMETFMPQDSEALADIQILRETLGSSDSVVLLVAASDIQDDAALLELQALTHAIAQRHAEDITQVVSITTLLDQLDGGTWDGIDGANAIASMPSSQTVGLIDPVANLALVQIALAPLTEDAFESLQAALAATISDLDLTIEVSITGQSVVDAAMLDAMTSDRTRLTLVGIGLVFVALSILYRNPLKSLLAVLPIALIVGWSGLFMHLLGFDYTPLTSTLGALIIGIGTEFTILVLMRFDEIRSTNVQRDEAIVQATSWMGKPIIVSAVTTMGGFSALILSDFQILSNFGIMTVVNIALALLSALIVLPALLGVTTKSKQKNV
jgi:hydrophobe/amphiphile efflux-3 (HAE3) family protein